MQHSYDGLDRPGGFSRVGLLVPLRSRDFRLLWSAMTVSLIGDGIFLIAMVWQAYALWNAPAALAVLGIGMTLPTIACLLLGGAISDRLDRRHILLYSDLARAVVVGVLAALSIAGALSFALLVVLVALYGVGTAFFTPAFEAIVPDIVPQADLARANALDQFVRPLALRMVGPALGGWLVSWLGAGPAFALDSASFAASAGIILVAANHAAGREDSRVEPDSDRGRLPLRAPERVALGDPRVCGDRVSRVPRPDRGAPSLPGQERAPRIGRRSRSRVCRRWSRRGGRRGSDGPARPPKARYDRRCTPVGRSRRLQSPATPLHGPRPS